MPTAAASALAPLVHAVLGDPLPVEVLFWDGSRLGTEDGPATVVLRSPDALRRILWSPNEVGFGRAFVTGDVEIEGNLIEAIRTMFTQGPQDLQIGTRTVAHTLVAAARLKVLGPPLPPPGPHSAGRPAPCPPPAASR